MHASFGRRFGLVLAGILAVVGIGCGLAGWTSVPEFGLGLIFGGVAALILGALLGPTGSPTMGHQRTGGAHPFNEDLVLKAEREDMVRSVKSSGRGFFAWLAAGALAILIGVLLRVL